VEGSPVGGPAVPTTSFIGRVADLAQIRQRFAAGDRLVTLVGPGGVGKTSLSRHFCATGAGSIELAWFCELAEASSSARVCEEVARAAKASGVGGPSADPVESLGALIERRGSILVVLDNCEQAARDIADAVSRWLRLAPASLWLATSREPLGLAAEHVHHVAPLARPPAPSGRAPAGVRLDEIAASDAVTLFVERARAARHTFELKAEDAEAIAGIVHKLDGLPLAIELAAARMALMNAPELLRRLEMGLGALATNRSDAPSRQRTMRDAVAWSWSLLDPWEVSALEQCAVFRGGFAVDAAEQVVDVRAHLDAPPLIDVIQELARKSLIRGYAPPEAPGRLRLSLFETVREYALERHALDGAGEAALRTRHARTTIDTASRWLDELDGGNPEQRAAAQVTLSLEHDNLLAAHAWTLAGAAEDVTQARDALRAMLALTPNLRRRASPRTELELLDGTLNGTPPDTDDRLRGWLLTSRSRLMMLTSRFDRADADLTEALRLAQRAGDRLLEGRALIGLFSGAEATERFDEAKSFIQRAVTALEGTTSCWLAVAHGGLAQVPWQEGRRHEALAHFEAARRLWAGECDSGWEGTAHYRPAMLAEYALLLVEVGRLDDAGVQLQRALETAHDLGPRTHALLRYYLGGYLHCLGDLDASIAAHRAAAEGRVAGPLYQPLILGGLGAALAGAGKIDEAMAALDEADAMATIEPTRAAMSVQRGLLDLARARACVSGRDDAARSTHVAKARARLDQARSLARATSDVRLACLALRAALDRLKDPQAGVPARSLEVARDGGWFSREGAGRTSVARRRVLQRLLRGLVDARLRTPGRALDVDEVCRLVWPGERILPAAARRRVQVAVSTLRVQGLRDVLRTDPAGYFLDPAVPVSVVPATGDRA
jgi:predicted ATPase